MNSLPGCHAQKQGKPNMRISKRLLLGLGLASLVVDGLAVQPVLAAETVLLFKVISSKDDVVIGIPEGEVAKMDGNAGGIAKALVANGSLSVWQYALRKSSSGDLEQAPLHKIGLIAKDSLRIEPYASPLKVLPIDETQK
jgi:hypothetical protein